ncbi:MAG TPA: hypothetical protein VKY37_08715 [Brumimicrobium sp.]|nr:hypothetical protein [Brumimicrobium sp.]
MGKKLVILSEWKDKTAFQQLKNDVENQISGVDTFFYLFTVENPKIIEELPQIPSVYYLSKKDFTLFGLIKTPSLRGLLINEKSGVLIVTMVNTSVLLKRVMKTSKLMSIGMMSESLPKFDISFKDTELKNGKFFKQINNYLTKIQL